MCRPACVLCFVVSSREEQLTDYSIFSLSLFLRQSVIALKSSTPHASFGSVAHMAPLRPARASAAKCLALIIGIAALNAVAAEALPELLSAAKELAPWLTQVRRELHQIPGAREQCEIGQA